MSSTVTDGTYTLVYKDTSHWTFKVETVKNGALAGKRIVSYLRGADNERDYQGFAFLTETGAVAVWKRARGGELDVRAGHLRTLFTMPERLEEAGMAYALASGRCRRCGRTLTVPASLNRGYGPECAQVVGAVEAPARPVTFTGFKKHVAYDVDARLARNQAVHDTDQEANLAYYRDRIETR